MRIGVNTLFLIPGEVGGSETYLLETLHALAGTQPDVEFLLFTNLENDAFLCERFSPFPNVDFHLLPFRARNRVVRILREQFELPRVAEAAAVDVLWSPGYVAPLRAPCPQVVSILDMQYLSHPSDLAWSAWLATHALVMQTARRCDHILTLSEFSKREIVRHTGVDPAKVTPTLLAAGDIFFTPQPPDMLAHVRRELVGDDTPYIFCVANTYPHKNVHRLIEAFGVLQTEFPHRLVLEGLPRRGERRVQAALARLPDTHRVTRLGRTPRAELAALYQAADLFVFPSLYEGFGLPVLEAMAAGTPVVAMRQASVPEVGGDAITYCEHDDTPELVACIREMLRLDPAARAARIAAARTRAATFNWNHTAGAIADVLRATAA
ncbi:MAG: glycosyltransferase family 1 protein [Verrucomicrobia bacterium]|nr:MAG: glycosyltransferase family 1 protein [Verrucomicrobiota bacterium]